jgi:hypothetical protein
VWRLTGPYDIDGGQMREAIERTAAHRRVEFRPLSEVVVTLPKRRAGTYAAWRGRQSVDGQAYPQTFAEVVKSVIAFARSAAPTSPAKLDMVPSHQILELTVVASIVASTSG